MKNKLLIFGLIVLMTIPITATPAKKRTVNDFAAGRIRFVAGSDATLSFDRKTVTPGIDYLVLLGATFETNNSRLELVTLNGNLYWVGKHTDFYFESIDPKGETSRMFLGKGAFVVETKLPFTLISGAGSVFFPANGRYLVMKNADGKDKVYINALKGDKPVIVKKSTIFSRIKVQKKENAPLMAWVANREANWKKTIARTNIFSHVDKLPPFVAYTAADGKTRWQRVKTVHPIYRMNGMVADNWFLYDPSLMNAMGLWMPYTIGMDDFEMALYFATNKWNSIRWAWNVEDGWHAEWYWDPLAGFGAEFNNSFLMDHNNFAELWLNYDYYGEMANNNWHSYYNWQMHNRPTVTSNNNSGRAIRESRSNPWTQVLVNRRTIRSVRFITGETNEWLRRRVDRTLRSERQARRLDTSTRLIARASRIAREQNEAGSFRRERVARGGHYMSAHPVYYHYQLPVATIMPVRTTTRRTRISRR